MTTPFVSQADLVNFTGQTPSAELAAIVLDAACEAVRGEINQHVNLVENDTVSLDGTGKTSLQLPELPVRSVSSVVAYDAEGENPTELVLNVDYIVGKAGILWRLGRQVWPAGHSNIFVTYTHGWDLTEDVQASGSGAADTIERVPSDIRFVALQLAADGLSAGKVGVGGVKSESIDNYSYSLAADAVAGAFSEALKRRLDRYRVEGLA